MKKYIPAEVETRWQKKWKETGLYGVDLKSAKTPFYLLVELPYSSGDLHIGHWFAFAVTDIFGRFKRMQGFDVFFPVGFDAFGLPAENAAIKRKLHPQDWTFKNIETMTNQFQLMGGIFDWDHVAITCLPEYYKWNQWIFLKMLERGIAYRGKTLSNWCPVDKTVLADEQVISGKCDRCGADIELKEISQWFLKITDYAEELLWPGSEEVDWPKSVIEGQNNWIGKREGAVIRFEVVTEGQRDKAGEGIEVKENTSKVGSDSFEVRTIEVFTTRVDTLFGATFLVLAPEHPILTKIVPKNNSNEVERYQFISAGKSQVERKEMREKTGVFTGAYAINPISGKEIPVWIADYALMGYGTGALFGDAHDERDVEFAKKYKIPLKPTLVTGKKDRDKLILNLEEVFTGEGILVDSGEFSGMTSAIAKKAIVKKLEEEKTGQAQIQYHLHDWSISRQRYWGTPIPIINCPKCGAVPVDEKDLPVELPYDVDFTPQGKPPLATAEAWMKVKCPKCGGDAQREPETMDGFFDNSWYFYRYLDPKNEREPFDKLRAQKWMPVDIYFGGAEHTLGHTMYSRFFTKFFRDLDLVDFEEYAKRRVNHGVILGPDSHRMSKSRGNVVNPDEEVKSYGADSIRLYLAFIGPYDLVAPWDPGGIRGVYHFLQRVWGLGEKVTSDWLSGDQVRRSSGEKNPDNPITQQPENLHMMHKTIKKVTEDIENIKFNTAVAALMEWLNYLSGKVHAGKVTKVAKESKESKVSGTSDSSDSSDSFVTSVTRLEYEVFLKLLAPFAPHITEELWQELQKHESRSMNHGKEKPKNLNNVFTRPKVAKFIIHDSIHSQPWPKYDPALAQAKKITLVVQVNGKLRDRLPVEAGISQQEAEKLALASDKVQRWIGDANPRKVIFVNDRLINFVI
ncbi:leucine--tRNA ligase [Candidatus Curtissbacteria bacterium]|nr:leucine--tRNA ligase [Candidatus Curtissbacteria bacterium]